MKKSNRLVKLFFFVIIVGIIGGVGYYFFFIRNRKTDSAVIPVLNVVSLEDSKNGIYVYKSKFDTNKTLLNGCYVDSIDEYIVVFNDRFRVYKGNCLNTIYMFEDNSSKLDFNKTKGEYQINYDGKKYIKNESITKVVVDNKLYGNLFGVNYDLLKFIIESTEYKGYYFSFKGGIYSTNKYNFSYEYNNDRFLLAISNNTNTYYKYMNSYNDIPFYTLFNDNLLIIDNKKDGDKYKGTFLMFTENNQSYDFYNSLPVRINDVVIDDSWNRLFRYDKEKKVVYVVFSTGNMFCNTGGVDFYEFKLTYDYKILGFGNPDFYKKGKGNESCDYIKRYYFEEA